MNFFQAEISDLEAEVKALQKSDREHKTIIDSLKPRIEDLEQRSNYQEDYNRRNNIRISGMMESPNGETWEQTGEQVPTLFKEKLQLPPMKLERVHRVGQPGRLAH